jgi:2-polyprenyl-3-methyl-5-hydroxy-6-metoxy-1,4-benzoquinol methylase
MQNSETHYKTLLGPIYAWMLGDLQAAFARGQADIDALPLPAGGIAVDLGAGLGLHSLPLAKRGFEVVALDSCQALLDELRVHAQSLPIETHLADLLQFRSFVKAPVRVIVCMGDTLTHLPSRSSVDALLSSAAAALSRGGVFAATFRDYATRILQDEQRFILVRADADRILTCFLEYQDTLVTVHDIVTEKEHGQWRQKISSYPKLRLAPEWLVGRLTEDGFSVQRDATPGGMVRIIATKK